MAETRQDIIDEIKTFPEAWWRYKTLSSQKKAALIKIRDGLAARRAEDKDSELRRAALTKVAGDFHGQRPVMDVLGSGWPVVRAALEVLNNRMGDIEMFARDVDEAVQLYGICKSLRENVGRVVHVGDDTYEVTPEDVARAELRFNYLMDRLKGGVETKLSAGNMDNRIAESLIYIRDVAPLGDGLTLNGLLSRVAEIGETES